MKALWSILFVTLSAGTFSQANFVKHFGVEDGLPSNHVYAAVQDKKGYIWFATDNGISRFDGKRFKNFTSADGLPDNDVFDLREDPAGRMWVSCFSNHRCYIHENKVYTRHNDHALQQLSSDTYCKFIHFNNKLLLQLLPPFSSYEVDKNGAISPLPFKAPGAETIANLLIISSPHGPYFYFLDQDYKIVDSLRYAPTLKLEGHDPVASICVTGSNRFIVMQKTGRHPSYLIKGNQILFQDTVLNNETFQRLHFEQGKLWMNKEMHGILPINEKLAADSLRAPLFQGELTSNFMTDREGNYWGCTFGEGVYMVPNHSFRYRLSGNDLADLKPLKTAVYKNEIYLGFTNGDVMELRSNRYYANKINPGSLVNRKKLSCLQADSLNIYVSRPDGIITIDKRSGKQTRFECINVKSFHKTDRSLVFGNHVGCFSLLKGQTIPDTVFYGRTTTVYQSNNGAILVGTVNGLFSCRKTKRGHWHQEKVLPSILNDIRISCLGETDSTLIIGTIQKGLVMVKDNDHEFVRMESGPSNMNCNHFFIDTHKNIWVATFEGVLKVSPTHNIHNYQTMRISAFNGLLSNIVNDVAVLSDTLYAASAKGVTMLPLNENRTQKNEGSPPVYIDEVMADGISLAVKDKILLPPGANGLELRFSGIDFKSLGNLLFRYRIAGLNNEWQLTPNNFVRLESLPHGDYRFEVMAMNAANIWSRKPAVVDIVVAPFWWEKMWVRVLVLLLLILFTYFIIRHRLQRKHRRELHDAAMKRHATEIELRAIKAQINPHFVFNTLNAVQYFISNNQTEEAEKYISVMARLIRKTLDFSNRTTVTVDEEITYLQNYLQLEKLRFDDSFLFRIDNGLEEASGKIEIPPMVLQPHVENALRHGLKNKVNGLKKLDVRFRLTGTHLICEIEDNGIGRKLAAENRQNGHSKTSLGTDLSQAKLNIYEYLTSKKVSMEIKDLYHETTNMPAGTIVRITINQ